MPPKHGLSIKSRLLLPVTFVLPAALTAAIGTNYYFDSVNLKQQLLDTAKMSSHTLSVAVKSSLLLGNKKQARTVLLGANSVQGVSKVELLDKEGKEVAQFHRFGRDITAPTEHDIFSLNDIGYSFGLDHLYYQQNLYVDSVAVGQVNTFVSLEPLEQLRIKHLINLAGGLGLSVLLSLLMGGMISRRVMRPTQRMYHAIQLMITRQNPTPIYDVLSNDEVGSLVGILNTLMSRSEQRDSQIKHSLEQADKGRRYLEGILSASGYAYLVVDHHGMIEYHSPAAETLFGFKGEADQRSNILSLVTVKESPQLKLAVRGSIELDEHLYEIKSPLEGKVVVSFSSTKLSHDKTLVMVKNMTANEVERNKLRVAAGVFDHIHDGLIVISSNGLISMVNQAFLKMLGYEQKELLNQDFHKVLNWQNFSTQVPTILESVDKFGFWQGEITEKNSKGENIPLFTKVSRIDQTDSQFSYDLVVMVSDISDAKQMEQLEYLAHHDPLTGLANRTKLLNRLSDALSGSHYSSNQVAVMYLDLDGFKDVNDTYGHDAGDAVLVTVAKRLTALVKSSDLVVRISGDEFVVLVHPADLTYLSDISDRILKSIMSPIEYNGQTLHVGASIGVKQIGRNEKDVDRILKSADTAMYQAKNAGKGQAILIGEETEAL